VHQGKQNDSDVAEIAPSARTDDVLAWLALCQLDGRAHHRLCLSAGQVPKSQSMLVSFFLWGTHFTARYDRNFLLITITRDIDTCLQLLQAMNTRWHTAKQCYLVLSSLLADIQRRRSSGRGPPSLTRSEKSSPDGAVTRMEVVEPEPKRRRTISTEKLAMPSSEGFPRTSFSPSADHVQQRRNGSSAQAAAVSNQQASVPGADVLDNSVVDNTASGWNDGPQPAFLGFDPLNGSSNYPNAQDLAYPPSDMMQPELSSSEHDPNYWGNFNFNRADVFESATWENLIGSAGPVPFGWDAGL